MKEIEKYLESQRALDENGKPDESLFGVKMYKSFKAASHLNHFEGHQFFKCKGVKGLQGCFLFKKKLHSYGVKIGIVTSYI